MHVGGYGLAFVFAPLVDFDLQLPFFQLDDEKPTTLFWVQHKGWQFFFLPCSNVMCFTKLLFTIHHVSLHSERLFLPWPTEWKLYRCDSLITWQMQMEIPRWCHIFSSYSETAVRDAGKEVLVTALVEKNDAQVVFNFGKKRERKENWLYTHSLKNLMESCIYSVMGFFLR